MTSDILLCHNVFYALINTPIMLYFGEGGGINLT